LKKPDILKHNSWYAGRVDARATLLSTIAEVLSFANRMSR
jgi:hypothetical protein